MLHARKDYQRIQDPEGKIGEEEPVVLFRAQDNLFIPIIRDAIERYHDAGASDVADALSQHLVRAAEWQKTHPTKTADL